MGFGATPSGGVAPTESYPVQIARDMTLIPRAAAGRQRGPRTERQRSVGAERSAEPEDRMPPQRHRSRCLRPSKHRRGRSARKAAPAPRPVGAARSGRSLLGGGQPVSKLPGNTEPCLLAGPIREKPHTIHILRHNRSENRLLGTLLQSVFRRRVKKRWISGCPLLYEQSEDCLHTPFLSRAGLFACGFPMQRVPYDRRGRVGLFWHSWQCEPFPH